MRKKNFTIKEDEYIRAQFRKQSLSEIAHALKRSKSGVQGRVKALGLREASNGVQDTFEQIKSKISQEGRITSVDQTGNAAYVKLVWLMEREDSQHEFTDYILLLKIKDEWKIVSKVSHVRDL